MCRGIGYAGIAQLVEHFLGKEEVTGSIPVPSLKKIGAKDERNRYSCVPEMQTEKLHR